MSDLVLQLLYYRLNRYLKFEHWFNLVLKPTQKRQTSLFSFEERLKLANTILILYNFHLIPEKIFIERYQGFVESLSGFMEDLLDFL